MAALLALGAFIERPRGHRAWLAAIPIVFVNYVAFRAQLRFWRDHLGAGDAFLVSAALESVAVYLAWQAHRALVKDDSALRLRLAAYGWAAGMGVLNYSHYMKPGWRPTAAAVVFGLMSAISPWLWSIHSRRESRDDLKARDLIEDHGVRLGFNRWFWYPLRSAKVQRLGAWAGENRPAAAIALWEQRRRDRKAARAAEPAALPATRAAEPAALPATRAAEPATLPATRAAEPAAVPAAEPAAPWTPLPAQPREPRPSRDRAARGGLAAARNDTERALVRELIENGPQLPSHRAFAADERLGGSRTTAARLIRLARDEMKGGASGVRVNGS